MVSRVIYAADLFCGAGGTSTGLLQAADSLGMDVKLLAVNHWQLAIATHSANHPGVEHRCEDLDNVNPRKAVPGGYLDLLVASPECMSHSRARGGTPKNDQSRATAFHISRWAEALYIENIIIENVPEFTRWGPLGRDGRPIKRLEGETFLAFIRLLEALDYCVEWRVINCADYGDATSRRRLFIMARRGQRPVWPEITHGAHGMYRQYQPYRTAREIIDWSVQGERLSQRSQPLKPSTMRRIERGLQRFCGEAFLVNYHGDKPGAERVQPLDEPLPTVDTSNRYALVEPYIIALNHGAGDERSYSVDAPMPTITSVDAWGLCQPFIVNYNGTGVAHSIDEPLPAVTGNDRFGLVQPVGVDVRFRMLQPHELAAAQGFPAGYQFEGSRKERVKQIGNAVPVNTARALCGAVLGQLA
jgi:DNA (cytosine-5)-methyltransferase 1